jgi:succinoglycan biosynthesis transport protein ExoP
VANSLSSDVGGIRLSDYGARLARRWYVVVIGLVLGLVASLAYSQHAGPEYTSTSLVLVTSTDALTQAGTTKNAINLDTEAQIVRSAGLATAAGKLMKTDEPPAQLIKNLTVTVPPNSDVLAIGYTAKTAKGAQEGSHAFAQAYLDNRTATVASQVKNSTTTLSAQVSDLSAQLKKVTAQIATLPPNSTDRAYADAQKTILSSQIMALNTQLAPLREASPTPGQILTDAPLPGHPTSPSKMIVIIGGLLVGLLIGLGLAALLSRLDRRIRRVSDVTSRLTVPVLGNLLPVRNRHSVAFTPLGDDADRLRNSVVAATPHARVIQVASTSGKGGAGSTALPLAASFAQVDHDAILVLLDPDSSLPSALGLSAEAGLSDVLYGHAELIEVLDPVPSLPRLQILPLGAEPAAISRMLASDRGAQLFAELRDLGAYVICESADPTQTALAQSLLRLSDIVLLAAERGETEVRHLEAVATEIYRLGGRVEGVVLAPPIKQAWLPPLLAAPAPGTIARIEELTAPGRGRKDATVQPSTSTATAAPSPGSDQPQPATATALEPSDGAPVAEAEDGPEWATDEEYEEYQRRTAAEGSAAAEPGSEEAAEDSGDEPDADGTAGAEDATTQQEQAGPLAVTRR